MLLSGDVEFYCHLLHERLNNICLNVQFRMRLA